MKHHLLYAAGLLMALIFGYRLIAALQTPSLGLHEAYLLGGLLIAYLLFRAAGQERRHAKRNQRPLQQ